jgi:lipopolysaccharide exporter
MTRQPQAFLKNDFLRQVFTLFSGAFAAQLIPFAATIFLARIFPEEAFGSFFLFSSALAVAGIVASLQYELSIVLPSSDREAINLFALSILIALSVSILSILPVAFFRLPIATALGDPGLAVWLWALPPCIFFTACFQSCSYWMNRKSQYNYISWTRVSRAGVMSGSQTAMGFTPLKAYGLIPGLIAAQFFATLHFAWYMWRKHRRALKLIRLPEMIRAGRKYRDIPLFNTLLQGMNHLSNQLPIFMLTRFFGPAAAAQYGMANRIIATPMGMISQAVGQVFYQRGAVIVNQKADLGRFVRKTYAALLKTALLPYAAMAFLAPWAFTVFFGENWTEAGILTRWLIPWLFVMFLNSPLTFLITILNKQRQMLLYDIFLLASRFTALYLAWHLSGSLLYAVIAYSFTGMIFNIFLLFYLLKISSGHGKTRQ